MKKLLYCLIISLAFCNVAPVYAEHLEPTEQTQVVQIYTNFKSVVGNPEWVLIVRDVDTGLVVPYLFEVKNQDNFWLAFTYGHNYKITASTLKFGEHAKINNFCELENCMLSGKSLYMTLTGTLTPDPRLLKCNVMKYAGSKFTIVKNN